MSASATVRVTTAQATVGYLAAQWSFRDGRSTRLIGGVAGIFGHGNVAGLGQALDAAADDLPFIQVKHEQAAVHLAAGYAKAHDRLATLACTASLGPGATNLVTGAATATANRLPVLLLPADTFASRRSGTVLQQLEPPGSADLGVNETLRPACVHFDRIARPEQVLDALPRAVAALTDKVRTGAVCVALHQDVQGEAFDCPTDFFLPRTWHATRPEPPKGQLVDAVAVLASARRPLVVAGGGVRYSAAGDALVALADECGLPIAETSAGKGIGSAAALAVGGIGVNGTAAANKLAAEADVVLLVGTRLSDFTTASNSLFAAPGVKFVAINIAPADAILRGAVPVVADARAALDAMRSVLRDRDWRTDHDYADEVRSLQQQWERTVAADRAPRRSKLTHSQAIAALSESVGVGDVVVAAAGSPPGDLLKLLDCSRGATAHIEFGFSCMGHEIPAALGYRLAARHNGVVIAWIGDGTLLMHVGELVTAAQEGLPIVVIVVVNGGFGSINGLQQRTTGRHFANEFRRRDEAGRLDGEPIAIDVAAVARGLGARAETACTEEELSTAIADARTAAGPVVVALEVDPVHTPPDSGAWWDLGVAEAPDQEPLATIASTMRDGRRRQRHHGFGPG